jgi:hypothetical protein
MTTTRYAEACERAADDLIDSAGHCSDVPPHVWCDDCMHDAMQAATLRALAQALRDMEQVEVKHGDGTISYRYPLVLREPSFLITLPTEPGA